nr:MAG TPA: hypothetical protein [Caudoviricetes sp.]
MFVVIPHIINSLVSMKSIPRHFSKSLWVVNCFIKITHTSSILLKHKII